MKKTLEACNSREEIEAWLNQQDGGFPCAGCRGKAIKRMEEVACTDYGPRGAPTPGLRGALEHLKLKCEKHKTWASHRLIYGNAPEELQKAFRDGESSQRDHLKDVLGELMEVIDAALATAPEATGVGKALNEAEALQFLKDYIHKHHNGRQNQFADAIGVSKAFVSDIVRGNRTLQGKVLEAIGLQRMVGYAALAAQPTATEEMGRKLNSRSENEEKKND